MRDANFLKGRITDDTLCTYRVSSNSGGVTKLLPALILYLPLHKKYSLGLSKKFLDKNLVGKKYLKVQRRLYTFLLATWNTRNHEIKTINKLFGNTEISIITRSHEQHTDYKHQYDYQYSYSYYIPLPC